VEGSRRQILNVTALEALAAVATYRISSPPTQVCWGQEKHILFVCCLPDIYNIYSYIHFLNTIR